MTIAVTMVSVFAVVSDDDETPLGDTDQHSDVIEACHAGRGVR